MKKVADSDKFARYFAAVRYLESLGNIAGGYQKTNLKSHPRPQMFLERMQEFLDLLGNPECGFKYIHITGTAGKGSVANTVHETLVRAGKRSGLFTSPFTVSTIEKIQVGTKYIDPLVLADIIDEIKPQIDIMMESGKNGVPSYFEMMLAIALIYFKKERCEYVVLEVGLGGRYDATNIIKDPLVTAITNIGLDHTNILGSTRLDIARDKSGIIKKDSKFFTTEGDPNILKVFENACRLNNAEYHPISVDGLDYITRDILLSGYICQALGIIRSLQEIKALTQLPARFEIVQRSPFVIIDGAHNPTKFDSVIYNLQKIKYKKLFVLMAVSADKDWKTMIRMIMPYVDQIYVTRFSVPGRQSIDPKMLLDEAKKYSRGSCIVELRSDPIVAYDDIIKKMSKTNVLLVTGSFYLAGDIRALYCSERRILEQRNACIKQ